MASGKTLYIKGDRDVEVTKPDVTLADLLSMECSDQSLLPKLKTMKILKFKKTGNQRCVISVLKIIACIHGQYPDMEVQNLGETDMIVTYEDQKTPSYAWHLTKTAFVTAVTFCGAVQVLFGIFAGIFVGCWSMALAEILNVFPIFMRRARIVRYASVFVIGAAIGKGLGAGLFFLKGW